MDVATHLQLLGGIARTSALANAGVSADRVERAARAGRIMRVRPGVYATGTAPPDVVRAARVGGRLTGASAAATWGLWTPPNPRLTVEVPRGASRLRDPDDMETALDASKCDVRIVWTARQSVAPGVAPLLDVLRACILTLPRPFAVAVLDSALRAHPVDRVELARLQRSLPPAFRSVFALADARAESGTESVLRVELEFAGLKPRVQIPVPLCPLERIDMLVADRLAIECDSQEHHGTPGQRLRDLRRDAMLTALGFQVLRFDYQQVLHDIESVLAAVLNALVIRERG